jgi:hypothetical protein
VAPDQPAPSAVRVKIALAVALLAAVALLTGEIPSTTAAQPQVADARPSPAQAWPAAPRATLRDLTVDPLLFLDATTAVGTTTSAGTTTQDSRLKLVIESDSGTQELRSLPDTGDPRFDNLTTAGDQLLWTESSTDKPTEIWAATLQATPGGPAGKRATTPRLLTADTGNALFYGTQHDLVVTAGRLHWAAGDDHRATEIRSLPLTGGDVTVHTEPGQWALAAAPWLTDDVGGQAGTIRLRNRDTGRTVTVTAGPAEWNMCSPAWCRVMVMSGEGLARIDMMRPDGTDRRRIAGPGTQSAVTDVAVLDRFEVLSEPRPDSDLTGTAGLVVHDLETGRTVVLAAAALLAATRDGMLWWSTGGPESAIWHTLDLRTI